MSTARPARAWWAGELTGVPAAWPARGWRRWQPPVRDVLFATVMTVVILLGTLGEAYPRQPIDKVGVPHTPDAAFLLVVAGGVVLAWRRRYPFAVLGLSMAAVVTFSLLGYVNGAALLLPAAGLWAVASFVPVRQALGWAVASTAVLMGATAAANPFGPAGGGFILIPANMAVAVAGGIAVRNRRAYVDSLRERADREARRQIDEERLRIARELHDVVAHTMATINVQASAAAQVLTDRPDKAAESLAAIRGASKDGLRELRAILNVLRQAEETTDSTQPAPGLARLDALAAGVRQAGLPVTVTITGRPRPLPAITDLAAFRISQEALTNAIRHAGPATAAVSVNYGEADLRIEVTDTGRGPQHLSASRRGRAGQDGAPPPGGWPQEGDGAGHGLRGMRERAAAAGGSMEIGPGPSGGFRVAARFPLPGGSGQAPVGAASRSPR